MTPCTTSYWRRTPGYRRSWNGPSALSGRRTAPSTGKSWAIVFGDPAKLERLNGIAQRATAARVRAEVEDLRGQGSTLAAVDAIALLESGLGELCGTTVAVVAPPEVRVARIMAREGIPEDYAWSRVRAQRPAEYFVRGCDHALVNDHNRAEEFGEAARKFLREIL